jgi:hypothetical protein
MFAIKELLQVDHQNERIVERILTDFSHELPETMNDAATIFVTFSRCFGQNAQDDEDQDRFVEVLEQLNITPNELFSLIASHPVIIHNPLIAKAKAADNNFCSRRARGFLLLLMHRCYMFAITDYFRFRVTSAIGYLRVEVEAAALMSIIRDNPMIASEWIQIDDDEKGRKFFNKHKTRIQQFLKKNHLDATWDMASGSAHHARFASIVSGLFQRTFKKNSREVDEYNFKFQDFSNEDLSIFVLKALVILRTQSDLFHLICKALPEVNDPILLECRLPAFDLRCKRLLERFQSTFPKDVARWKAGTI